MGEPWFSFGPERFDTVTIILLVFAALGFIFTLASTRLAERILKNREFEGGEEEKEQAKVRLSLIMKIIGLTVVVAFALGIIFKS